ncbi:unnamed protein product [Rhizophagus irregularis]|nr:unnamed protein product [Rhizophagus irregularis]
MDLNWGEISSSSSAVRRNFNLAEGKRRRIGSKSDGIGTIVNADDKEILIFELSGAPTRLPTRHPEGDKTKGYNCFISEMYIVDRGLYCRRTLSQFTLPTGIPDLYYLYDLLRAMFCFQGELVKSLDALQKLKLAKARKLEVIDPISYYMLRLPPS